MARTSRLERRSGIRRFLFEHGLTVVMLTLLLLSFAGQVISGRATYNDARRQHGEPAVTVGQYLTTGAFLEATAENWDWQSEFFSVAVLVLFSIWLRERGSPQSKPVAAGMEETGG